MFGRKKKTVEEEIEEVEALPRLSDEDAAIWSEPGPRNYEEVDTTSPQFPNDFIADVVSTTADSARAPTPL